ncbi:MAG: DUF4143 domain-containing protein [Bacteroidales bacterium]|nr:DUF4143 domain-containing protein [Bacteroidales bacterium]
MKYKSGFKNGIRNALISDYSLIENRPDAGALWENFLVAESLKKNAYEENWVNSWFWRTTAQREIDYLEETEGQLHAYEFKWNPLKALRISKSFSRAYPNAKVRVIHFENLEEFLL